MLRLVILIVGLGACFVSCESLPPGPSDAFDNSIGAWTGVRRDVATGSESRMILRVETLPGGAGQFRALEVFGDRGPYRGAAVQRFDPVRGEWVRLYTNSASRPFARYRAAEIQVDRSVWRSISPGRTRESRLVSEHLPDGLWRRTMSVYVEERRVWRGLWVDELRRGDFP
jgi:hypothetical protein